MMTKTVDDHPEIGIRSRSYYCHVVHRHYPGTDGLEPPCEVRLRQADAEWRTTAIAPLIAFNRWSLCSEPECFGERIRVAIPADGADGTHFHAPGGPCGDHRTRDVMRAIDYLRYCDLDPCAICQEYHRLRPDLDAPDPPVARATGEVPADD